MYEYQIRSKCRAIIPTFYRKKPLTFSLKYGFSPLPLVQAPHTLPNSHTEIDDFQLQQHPPEYKFNQLQPATMGAYKYLKELWRKKQSDVLRFLLRVR